MTTESGDCGEWSTQSDQNLGREGLDKALVD